MSFTSGMRLTLGIFLGWQMALALAADVRSAWATFPSDANKRWAAAYATERGTKVDYAPGGSGDGVERITSREVDFGASDTP